MIVAQDNSLLQMINISPGVERVCIHKYQNMKKFFCFLVVGLLLIGCDKDESISIPGKFELQFLSEHEITGPLSSQIASLQGSSSPDVTELFLDTIKSSKTFYFIISNYGHSDITDVSIATDNKSFICSPITIPLIPGSTRNELFMQAFSIDVLHGTKISGIGSVDFLSMGENSCNLTINGKTLDGRSLTTVSLKAKIVVYAELMSISVFQGKFEYDLHTPDRRLHGGDPFHINEMNIFHYYTIDPPVAIRNTGNVNIEMTIASFDTDDPIIQTAVIQPDDTLNLLLPFRDSESGVGGRIKKEPYLIPIN